MKCENCGADIAGGGWRCEFCGSGVDLPSNVPRAAVFEQVKQSCEYARRDRQERLAALPKHVGLAAVAGIVFLVVFVAMSLVMGVVMWAVAGIVGAGFGRGVSLVPLAMSLCPMAFIGLGVFLLIQCVKKWSEFQRAPVLARAAILVGKRTAVSGGSRNSSATTGYHLTAEFEDGTRAEFQAARPDLYGCVAEGDAGVLFSRTSVALDFEQVLNNPVKLVFTWRAVLVFLVGHG